MDYNLIHSIREDHDGSLYSVQIYKPYEKNPAKIIFATVGSNRCSIYEYTMSTQEVHLIDAYMDADQDEVLYTCAWSTDINTNEPLVVFAGLKGLIRCLVPFKNEYKNVLIGHGSSVNDLRFHPTKYNFLLSASKDYTLRLWNVNNNICVAIFGGAEGHCDEVLNADFNLNGTKIMSCSIDHHLKMWNIQTPKIQKAMDESENFKVKNKSFPTVLVNFPDFSTRDVHSNYIDCVRWFGDLVLSKSCENCIILWKPGLVNESIDTVSRSSKNVTVFQKFDIKDCDIWFVRFGLDFGQKILSLGTSNGKIYVWDLSDNNTSNAKRTLMSSAKSKSTIRSIALSLHGKELIAVNDEAQILIWQKQ